MEDVFFDRKSKQDWRGQKMERRQKKKWLNLWPTGNEADRNWDHEIWNKTGVFNWKKNLFNRI